MLDYLGRILPHCGTVRASGSAALALAYVADGMENTFWTAFSASLLAAFVTSIGIYVIRRFEGWGRENSIYFVCFAAGALVYVGATHLLPQAETEQKKYSLFALGAGILVAVIIVLSKG